MPTTPVVMFLSDNHSETGAGCAYSLAGKLENEQDMENHELNQIRRPDDYNPEFRETVIKRDGKLYKLELRHTTLSDEMLNGTTAWPSLKADYFVIVISPLTLFPSQVESHKQNIQSLLTTFKQKYPHARFMLLSSTSDEYVNDPTNPCWERKRKISEQAGIDWAKNFGADEHRDVNTDNSWVYNNPKCQIRTFYYDIHRKAYEAASAVHEASKSAGVSGGARDGVEQHPNHTASAPTASSSSTSRSSQQLQMTVTDPSSETRAPSSSTERDSLPQRCAPLPTKKWFQFWKSSRPKGPAAVQGEQDQYTPTK